MDPNATLTEIAIALMEGDTNKAEQLAEDLTEWLRKGGFEPDWSRHPAARKWFFQRKGAVIQVRMAKLGAIATAEVLAKTLGIPVEELYQRVREPKLPQSPPNDRLHWQIWLLADDKETY
jgi:hypothetical protein